VIEERLFDLIHPLLRSTGSTLEAGEDFREPPLEVLRYHHRSVKWNAIPILGRAVSVTAVVRQPFDIGLSDANYAKLMTRIAAVASRRFPPWQGLVIGLTVLVLTPEPIGPSDDAVLARVLDTPLRKYRVVPFGLFRLNLGQEAISFALKESPDRLFSEAELLADTLSEHLRRYVPLLDI
jgi:hypothetical protein